MYKLVKKVWFFLKMRRFSSKKLKWHKSNWQTLTNNSIEYIEMMKLANRYQIYNQVLHNGHIAVELIIKAAISRHLQKHPDGHEIRNLTIVEINGVKILAEINASQSTQSAFNKIYTAWKMQYRYEKVAVTQNEASIYLNAFQEAYTWTKNKYCQ